MDPSRTDGSTQPVTTGVLGEGQGSRERGGSGGAALPTSRESKPLHRAVTFTPLHLFALYFEMSFL